MIKNIVRHNTLGILFHNQRKIAKEYRNKKVNPRPEYFYIPLTVIWDMLKIKEEDFTESAVMLVVNNEFEYVTYNNIRQCTFGKNTFPSFIDNKYKRRIREEISWWINAVAVWLIPIALAVVAIATLIINIHSNEDVQATLNTQRQEIQQMQKQIDSLK